MTLYFSHSAVEGILLWGFWDQAVYDQKIALASGNNVTVCYFMRQFTILEKLKILKDIQKP